MSTLFSLTRYCLTRQSSRNLSNISAQRAKLNKKWVVTLEHLDDNKGYTIKLNDIAIKTPMKKPFNIKDEGLAQKIFAEWKSREPKKKVDLPKMHLTTLAYEAIDNPFDETRESIVNDMLEYLRFDTIRFRDSANDELLKVQSRHWDPLIGWFEHTQDCIVPIDYGNVADVISLPKDTEVKISDKLMSIDRWPLVATRYMTKNLKSFILATTLTERFLKIEQAVDSARLENKFQVEKWSKVEWEHDVDEQTMRSRVAAGCVFYHLSK